MLLCVRKERSGGSYFHEMALDLGTNTIDINKVFPACYCFLHETTWYMLSAFGEEENWEIFQKCHRMFIQINVVIKIFVLPTVA